MKLLTALLCATCLWAQSEILNPGFDTPGPAGLPSGWTVPEAASHFEIRRVGTGCKLGACVEMNPGPASGDRPGILEQTFSATQLLGKVAWIGISSRVEPGGKSALLVKVTNAVGEVIYTDNTLRNRAPQPLVWSDQSMFVPVTLDAETITIQVLASGANVVVDSLNVSLPTAAPWKAPEGEGPSRLNRTAQNNLVAFARMYGAVRHFHPTSEVTEADWNMLAVEGVRTLDYAIEPESFARRLNVLFERVAPAVKAYVGGLLN